MTEQEIREIRKVTTLDTICKVCGHRRGTHASDSYHCPENPEKRPILRFRGTFFSMEDEHELLNRNIVQVLQQIEVKLLPLKNEI